MQWANSSLWVESTIPDPDSKLIMRCWRMMELAVSVCISTCDLSRSDVSRWAGARGKMEFSAEMPLSLSEIGNSYYTVWKMHGLAW